MKAVFDTNILIDYLHGVTPARTEFERYEQVFISTVTWMEVVIGAPDDVADTTERFLGTLGAIPVDDAVARRPAPCTPAEAAGCHHLGLGRSPRHVARQPGYESLSG